MSVRRLGWSAFAPSGPLTTTTTTSSRRNGGRTYEAIFETPKEQPDKPWKTLCLVDSEPRSKGNLELGPLVDALIAHGLAQPTDFLATAELGSEVA